MTSKRLPLSCENCRQRKIRCIGSGHSPCQTCARRGYASSCRFKRQTPLVGANAQIIQPQQSDPSLGLMGNVASLEDLLKQNIALTTALLSQKGQSRLPSPISSPEVPSSLQPSLEEKPLHGPLPSRTGRLVVSTSNHVRFAPSHDIGDSDLLEAMQEPASSFPVGFPFFSEQSGSVSDEVLDLLPPLLHLEELKSTYFRVFSPLFHVLHDPTFHTKYQAFKRNPRSTPLAFVGLLFVILSLAVTALDDNHLVLTDLGHGVSPHANVRSLSAKYRSAAMRCLAADNFMVRHNLCTVQCLVLLIYAMNHAQEPAWSLLGTTLHIAVAIGCAVDPDHLNVDRIQAEERRRCWAALRMLYTIQNTCLGNLMPFRVEANVALPADIEDDELVTGSPSPRNDSVDTPPTQMTYLLYKFRLYDLAVDICQLPASIQAHDHAMIETLDVKITQEQECHQARFTTRLILKPYDQAHFYILTIYTNHLMLLLHRSQLNTVDNKSCEKCLKAATGTLSKFEALCSTPEFGSYRWYMDGLGSFYAFFAITTLLVLLGNPQHETECNPETVVLLVRCVEKMKGSASRSSICQKAVDIVDPIVQCLTSGHVADSNGDAELTLLGESPNEGLWPTYPGLESMFYDVPCEQWLTPSEFVWNAAQNLWGPSSAGVSTL
ncbi:fungal-specific transcription factor domain-containing protein [Aspergillus pseudotamarii]|uniref:Fungal-specific transcription factor domain-containing protein n=1 Tax=Aspergillus pseudotamarii TaxID=132259 RepID=A0A5N6TC39_ASPPS|nr:fungal-specific transcription factor domain-containing protein [Aspergillus pseudotamarii]KAE8143691.1 fungal-specific transcription factor domain-containing protein [Aspergillus pseudotamarii]